MPIVSGLEAAVGLSPPIHTVSALETQSTAIAWRENRMPPTLRNATVSEITYVVVSHGSNEMTAIQAPMMAAPTSRFASSVRLLSRLARATARATWGQAKHCTGIATQATGEAPVSQK